MPMRETSFIKMYSLSTHSRSNCLKGNIPMIKIGSERKLAPPQSTEVLVLFPKVNLSKISLRFYSLVQA